MREPGDTESDELARTALGIGDASPTANIRGPNNRPTFDAPKIPGYQIVAVLGEGGMGTVYEAEQQAPRRRVAIKILHGRSMTALVRFQAEAEIMARLDHPGIARVLEAGEADGPPFLVMEHVDGTTLEKVAKPLPLRARLELFLALCEAVHHAHLKGVIHRDLKPTNVMVKDGDRVVVLDFGVARLAIDDGKTPGTTRAGELIGTPLYMSPEQARLRADEVDVRTDVYTLGVMLYELACGELPYESRDAPLPVLTCMICEDPPIPLVKRAPHLRGDLDAITCKALSKEPIERYQSVAALADDVRRHLDELPVSVRPPSTFERARRFVRRRPLLASAIVASLLAATVFAVVVTWLWLDASAARRVAEDARSRTETARAQLESRTNQLVLRQARALLARDPTQAIAWLGTLTSRDVDPGTAWSIANEALARGVAKDVLRGHTDEVHWVEAVPGGGFVSGAYDGRAILWTQEDPPRQHVIYTAKHGRVHAARPSPDGREIAIGGDGGELHVVDRDGKVLAELSGHKGDVQHFAWSPGGEWLATSDDHGNLYLWPHGRAPGRKLDTSAPSPATPATADPTHAAPPIGTLAFSPSGHELVAGDHAGTVWLWSVADNKRIATTVHEDVADLWTDGTRVIAVDGIGAVHTWHRDAATFAIDRVVQTGLNCKRAVFGPGGAWVLLGGVGGSVTRVEGATVEPLASFQSQVRSLAISSDGRWIAAGGDDASLELRDRTTGQEIALHGHTGRIRHVAFADDDRVLLSSDSDGIVRRWEIATMPKTVIDTHGEPSERIAVSPDGAFVASVDVAGNVSTWRFADHRYLHLGHLDGRATALAIAGDVVISGTAEGVLTWWTSTGGAVSSAPVRQALHATIKSIATSRDAIAVATSSPSIAMFSVAGVARPSLAGHPGGTDALAFSPDGAVLASGGQDRSVRIWNVAGATQLAALDGPHGDTHFVAIAGQLVIAAGNDGSILAWRLRGDRVDPASRVTVAQHIGAVTALAVSETAIAAAGRDATLSRATITNGVAGTAETTSIAAAATALALAGDGTVRAVTRAGAGVRWSPGASPVVEIDHGLREGAQIPSSASWVEAFDDGTFVVAETRVRSFDELRGVVGRATSFTLPR